MIGAFIELLQQRLAPPAARVHHPGPCSRQVQPKGGVMFRPSPCPENRNRYRAVPPHAPRRAPSDQGSDDLVRDGCGDAEGPGCLPGDL